jgi:hypothetical protein
MQKMVYSMSNNAPINMHNMQNMQTANQYAKKMHENMHTNMHRNMQKIC